MTSNQQTPGIPDDFPACLGPSTDLLLSQGALFWPGPPASVRPFPLTRAAGARIRTRLAVQEEPGKPFGQATTARYPGGAGQSGHTILE
ncbi:MAG: hypothetical protein FJX77_16180 [Armatimonadetes bacterium]|nr:hypothetical protein [Armatimonadota bacterium]